ncbi:hypothetical protein JMJ77_0009945, partial [Colletotrichum scovillei]
MLRVILMTAKVYTRGCKSDTEIGKGKRGLTMMMILIM